MAAALLRAVNAGIIVTSAGLMPDDAVDPFAVAVTLEEGADISAHTPIAIAPEAITPDTVVITLTPAAFKTASEWHETVGFTLENWDLPPIPSHEGPRESILDGYRAIKNALKTHITNRFRP